ncbi:hypothetical protein DAMA08_000070 [Martiniozyma asiatica (nom. inval.)]|nr:hypothetical protein DAMA08_000070 [Martiniozyma asiatica]
MINFGILVFSSLAMGNSIVWSGPVWEIWIAEFNCTYNQLNISTAICFIFLAFGCFFLQPISSHFGKRCVYLSCSLIQIIGNIIYITANDIKSIWAATALVGFSSAPIYAIVILSSTDLFFQHERAFKVSVLVFTIFGSTSLAPFIAGYITSGLSWKWCPKVLLIWFCCLFVLQFFFMEETSFTRNQTNEEIEKDVIEQIKSNQSGFNSGKQIVVTESKMIPDETNETKKSYLETLKIFETKHAPKNSIFKTAIWPFNMYLLPIVVWCGLLQGLQQMWLSYVINTQALFFSAAPYNFSTGSIGLTNLSTLIGTIIGTFYGLVVDKVGIYFSKKNNGVFEPEFLLWTLTLPVFANGCGILLYGLGASYKEHWIVAMIGDSFIGFSMTTITSISFTYCCDCYPELENNSMIAVGILSNLIPIAFSFCVNIWLTNSGTKLVTWMCFLIAMFFNTSFIFLIIFGKSVRRSSIKTFKKLISSDFL